MFGAAPELTGELARPVLEGLGLAATGGAGSLGAGGGSSLGDSAGGGGFPRGDPGGGVEAT